MKKSIIILVFALVLFMNVSLFSENTDDEYVFNSYIGKSVMIVTTALTSNSEMSENSVSAVYIGTLFKETKQFITLHNAAIKPLLRVDSNHNPFAKSFEIMKFESVTIQKSQVISLNLKN